MEEVTQGLPERWRTSETGPETPGETPAVSPSTAPAPAEMDAQMQLGQELATIFKNNNVHPVLIFGSAGSGKTSMLASLFRYMQLTQAEATQALHDELFPSDDPRWQKHAVLARQLYYGKVLEFIELKAPQATLDATPFFIPVKVTRTTGEEATFAFLEGRGEWYMPAKNSDSPFRPFQSLLRGLLQNYNEKATAIYVAPCTTGVMSRDGRLEPANAPKMVDSDLGLLGALKEYVNLRRATFHRDRHVFLMTKWDLYCGGISEPEFVHPPPRLLSSVLQERFRFSWAHFCNLNFHGSSRNKMFSTYCSAVIDNMKVLSPAHADSAVVDFYPRKLWDLLYENHTGLPLYPDVRPRPPGPLDRLISWLRG